MTGHPLLRRQSAPRLLWAGPKKGSAVSVSRRIASALSGFSRIPSAASRVEGENFKLRFQHVR